MILAAIDIGTNTALLLIAKLDCGEIRPLYEEERIVRLGEGVDAHRQLLTAAMDRAVSAVIDYKEIAERHSSQSILLSGTSAVRDATNRDTLLDKIRTATGIEMRVLSGDEEARLTWLGALSNKQVPGGILMMDIGGGSTEFMIGTQDRLEQAVSLDIGSVRLTERYISNDPPLVPEVQAVRICIREALSETKLLNGVADVTFVGVAGTITTLVALHQGIENYDSARIDGQSLNLEDIETILDSMLEKSLSKRKMITGLNPERADVILAGTLLLYETMQYLDLGTVLVSDRGLRYGLAFDYAETYLK